VTKQSDPLVTLQDAVYKIPKRSNTLENGSVTPSRILSIVQMAGLNTFVFMYRRAIAFSSTIFSRSIRKNETS
jgi:hypothetical protein